MKSIKELKEDLIQAQLELDFDVAKEIIKEIKKLGTRNIPKQVDLIPAEYFPKIPEPKLSGVLLGAMTLRRFPEEKPPHISMGRWLAAKRQIIRYYE